MQSELRTITFPGKIHLIRNDHELAAMGAQLSSATAIGFDTETKPSFKKGEVFKVALLQLSTDSDAFIFKLHGLTQFHIIQSLFENREIVKVGAAIRDDLKQLQKTFRFVPQGFVELQDLAKKKGLSNFGLKGMTEEVLQVRLSKGQKLTNWEARELTGQQLLYAATDAWIGLRLYQRLAETTAQFRSVKD